MPHSRVPLVLALVVVIGLLVTMTGQGQAQFVLYDDFSSGVIDPEKWSGNSLEGGFNGPSEETIRVIESGQLRLKLVSWGSASSNTGSVQSRQGLSIRQLGTPGGSGFITGLSANVTVLGANAQNCGANTSASSQGRAQIFGFFFNDGTGGPTSNVGNILARIQLEKENNGTNQIVAFLSRCTNADCSNADVIAMPGNPVTFTTTWSTNAPVNLKLVWDEANGRFKFTATDLGTAASEVQNIVYAGTVTDAGPPTFNDTKQVRLQNFVENCTAVRKRTLMDAVFDNVRVQRVP
jgi:hypothetical protein